MSLLDCGVRDGETAKYVAQLRTLKKTDAHPLPLKTNMAAGHGGASGHYDYLREIALDCASLLTPSGLRDGMPGPLSLKREMLFRTVGHKLTTCVFLPIRHH